MIPSSLDKSIKENDVNAARAFFVVQINNERKKSQFEMAAWAETAEKEFNTLGSDFFQPDNGKIQLPLDKTLWSKALWSDFRVELEYNFSKFKLYSILELMAYLRHVGHEDFQGKIADSVVSTRTENSEGGPDMSAASYSRSSIAGAVIGGISGKLIGLALTGVVAGAVVGVAYAYYKNKRT